VGLIARIGIWPLSTGDFRAFSIAGTRKAMVFPVPVFAFTTASASPRQTGRAWDCTSVQNS